MKAHYSQLGYALLGLIHQQPLSGYDVKKIFASTPMAGFSDSPGAIYPALRRLEKECATCDPEEIAREIEREIHRNGA